MSLVVPQWAMPRNPTLFQFVLIVFSTVMLASFALPAGAGERVTLLMPERSHDITRPRNREEVLQAYGWLVDATDGVTEREAKLIAEREAVDRKLDEDFDISKPKIIGSTDQEFQVRLPAKFSMMHPPKEFVVCIDKKDGHLTCAEERQ